MTGRFQPGYADVVGTLALLVAMSGTAYAAHALPKHSVGSAQLEPGAVTSSKIKNGQVKSTDVADGSLTSADVADGSLTSADVADHSLALVDVVRVDATVAVSVNLGGDSCSTLDLAVPGAEVGQLVMLLPTQTVPVVFSPPRVSAAGVVTTRACAVGLGAILINSPFRVLTLS